MIVATFDNLTDLLHKTVERLIMDPSVWDFSGSYRRLSFNNVLMSKSCSFSLCLSEVGLTKSRWTKLIRQYRVSLPEKEFGPGSEVVIPLKFIKGVTPGHERGPCLLGITKRKDGLVFYSRSSFVPDRMALDLCLAYHLSKYFWSPGDAKFTWFIGTLHLQPIWLIPYLYSRGILEESIKGPFGKEIKYFLEKMEMGIYNFKPLTRKWRRLKEMREGKVKKCPIESLKLEIYEDF